MGLDRPPPSAVGTELVLRQAQIFFEEGVIEMSTKPPRTRPGQIKPGGRHLRRALTKLEQRRGGEQHGKGADHGHNRWPHGAGVTMPGSMKR